MNVPEIMTRIWQDAGEQYNKALKDRDWHLVLKAEGAFLALQAVGQAFGLEAVPVASKGEPDGSPKKEGLADSSAKPRRRKKA